VTSAIIDTGPLIAFFDRSEGYHQWVTDRINEVEMPLLVCEPVLVEATYLLKRNSRTRDFLFELIQDGALKVAFRIEEHVGAVRKLLQKYRDTPISLADACIVVMAEIHGSHSVLTLDSDFLIYRKSDRRPLPLILVGREERPSA
jgi:predicted nucleic acid-binding protein